MPRGGDEDIAIFICRLFKWRRGKADVGDDVGSVGDAVENPLPKSRDVDVDVFTGENRREEARWEELPTCHGRSARRQQRINASRRGDTCPLPRVIPNVKATQFASLRVEIDYATSVRHDV